MAAALSEDEFELVEIERRLRRREIERMLEDWARVRSTRDEVVRQAATAGVSVRRIQQLTGIARTTVGRILEHGGTDGTP